MNVKIINLAKERFIRAYTNSENKGDRLQHVQNVEFWAKRFLDKNKSANQDIVLIAVWLHDIGVFIESTEEKDHAIISEKEAIAFLKEIDTLSETEKANIIHSVRAHGVRDIKPETIEAKILAVSDAASHFTTGVYLKFYNNKGRGAALSKLERDLKKMSILEDLKIELEPLYEAWFNLLTLLPEEK